MHFETLTKGIYSMIVSVGMAVGTTLMPSPPPPSSPDLQRPIVESANMVSENYNLEKPQDSATEHSQEELVIDPNVAIVLAPDTTPEIEKEATASPVVTVEKPKKVVSPQPSAISQKQTEKKVEAESVKSEVKAEKKDEITPKTIAAKLTDGAEKLFTLANQHRAKIGLPALEKEERICQMVAQRAPQVYDEVFKEGPMHKGFKALNLPYWATENIAAYDSIDKNFDFWLRDDIHRKAIESAAKYSCVACSGTYCSQIFTSFIPK